MRTTIDELDETISQRKFTMMVIGGPDTGKSSFVKRKAQALGGRTAVVDLDPGQQSVGLPSTVAWCMAKDIEKRPFEFIDLFFFGSTTPSSNIGRLLTGSRLMYQKAVENADRVLIDTSGLVAWPVGTMLKLLKIELLSPDIIVAFERDTELNDLFKALRGMDKPKIFRFTASENANIRSQNQRTANREEVFRSYFSNAQHVEIDIANIGISEANLWFRDTPTLDKPQDWFNNRLVGIQSADRKFIALGIVQRISMTGKMVLLTPLKEHNRIVSVVFGQIRVAPGGEQISYV